MSTVSKVVGSSNLPSGKGNRKDRRRLSAEKDRARPHAETAAPDPDDGTDLPSTFTGNYQLKTFPPRRPLVTPAAGCGTDYGAYLQAPADQPTGEVC